MRNRRKKESLKSGGGVVLEWWGMLRHVTSMTNPVLVNENVIFRVLLVDLGSVTMGVGKFLTEISIEQILNIPHHSKTKPTSRFHGYLGL